MLGVPRNLIIELFEAFHGTAIDYRVDKFQNASSRNSPGLAQSYTSSRKHQFLQAACKSIAQRAHADGCPMMTERLRTALEKSDFPWRNHSPAEGNVMNADDQLIDPSVLATENTRPGGPL